MARYTANALQTVEPNANILFDTQFPMRCGCCQRIPHRIDSGIFELRGGATYDVSLSANITGATADTPVVLSLAIDGEQVPSATMISTPAVADALNNVSTCTEIAVPCGCCYSLACRNTGDTALDCQNVNLSVGVKEV